MEREHNPRDAHLRGDVVQDAVVAGVGQACLLVYNPAQSQFECRNRNGTCPCFTGGRKDRCVIPFRNVPEDLMSFFERPAAAEGIVASRNKQNGTAHTPSQLLIPVAHPHGEPLGLLVIEPGLLDHPSENEADITQSIAGLYALAMQKSQMIKKMRLLSKASNVLLAEFESKSLSEKFDYVVEKATEILDAELCSLWLVREGQVCLETSFSQEGKRLIKRRVAHPIKDEPKSGLTGFIAFHKKPYNAYGLTHDNHPTRNPENPVDFLDSPKVYSELAYPLLDGDNLIGLLIAYNKLGPDGKPIQDAGFSKEFDEPLIKVLATKLVISVKNSTLLKKLRDYEAIVESTPDPVVMCDQGGYIRYMNQGAKDLFGDFLGCNVTDRYPSDQTSTGLYKAREIRKHVRLSKDKRLKNLETTVINKDGEPIPISLSVSMLHDEHGNEAGTIGIAKDQREIKALLDAGQSLLEMHDIDRILHQITKVCLRLPKSVRAYLKLYDEENDHLVFRALNSKHPGEDFPYSYAPKDRGMTGHVFHTQQPALAEDVSNLAIDRYYAIFPNVKSKIVVPITYIDKETEAVKQRGVISVDSEEPNAFSQNDLYFLRTLASQAAVALENANLIASKNGIINKLQAYDKVQKAATGISPDEDQILESVLDAVVEVLGFEYATISTVDAETRTIGASKGRNVSPEFLQLARHALASKDIQAWVVRSKMQVHLTGWDDRLDREIFDRFYHDRLVRTIIPILVRGEVLGTLETGYDKSYKSQIEKDEIEALQSLVNLAGIGIEQVRLMAKLKQDLQLRNDLEKQLEALNQASVEIFNAATEQEAVRHIFHSLRSIGYGKGMLALINESTRMIEGCYAAGENWQAIVPDTRLELNGKNILAQAIRAKSALLNHVGENECEGEAAALRKAGIQLQYVIPLIVKDKPIGTLQIDLSDRPDLMESESAVFRRRMNVVETFARQAAVAIRNIRALITIDQQESIIAETAHEFRSPLHNIMTEVGSLRDAMTNMHTDQSLAQALGVIEEEIQRAKRQMNNTLLLSDRTREKLDFVLKPDFLQDVIEGCVHAYKLRALDRGLRFVIKDGVKRLPRIEFDHDRMEQAFTNLIDNAVKYSHYNQYITISGFDDGTLINVDITDRGLGIPPADFESIFQSFMRSEPRGQARYIPGTGLGLKITREIVRKHGGEIKVWKSAPFSKNPRQIKDFQDYLTTFRLTLPKARKEN